MANTNSVTIQNLEAAFAGDRSGFASFIESDDDIKPALFQIQRMCMALRSEAEYGQGLVVQAGQIGVLVVVNSRRHRVLFGDWVVG